MSYDEEEERLLLGDAEPKSPGYGDRMLEAGDQRRKEQLERGVAPDETRCDERWIWREDNSSRCTRKKGHAGRHYFIPTGGTA